MVKRSKTLTTSTEFYAKKISKEYNVDFQSMNIVPLGINIPDKDKLNLKPNNEKIKVLFVGRFENRKGIRYLLEAIPEVLKRRDDLEFILVGDDSCGGYAQGFVKKNTGIVFKENVSFPGFVSVDELEMYYRDCDIFVAPSLSESFGLIFAEAMSWGKPVIACDVCAVDEVVENGGSGLLVSPRDSSKIAEAIIELAQNKDKRLRMGAQGRQLCEEKVTQDIMVKKTEVVYQKLVTDTYFSKVKIKNR